MRMVVMDIIVVLRLAPKLILPLRVTVRLPIPTMLLIPTLLILITTPLISVDGRVSKETLLRRRRNILVLSPLRPISMTLVMERIPLPSISVRKLTLLIRFPNGPNRTLPTSMLHDRLLILSTTRSFPPSAPRSPLIVDPLTPIGREFLTLSLNMPFAMQFLSSNSPVPALTASPLVPKAPTRSPSYPIVEAICPISLPTHEYLKRLRRRQAPPST